MSLIKSLAVMALMLALGLLARSSIGLTSGEHGEALWNRLWTRNSDAQIQGRIHALRDAGAPVPSPETYRLELRPSWYEELLSARMGAFQIWDHSRRAWFDVKANRWFYESARWTPAGTELDLGAFAFHAMLRDYRCQDPSWLGRYEYRQTIEMKYRVFNHIVSPHVAHGAASHPARVTFVGTSISPDCNRWSGGPIGLPVFDQRTCTVPRGESVEVTPRRTNMTIDAATVTYNVP